MLVSDDSRLAGECMNYFTIGLAGHIDHGKTTLTGALTGIDTDRLKEEKERNISIEPGFAPFRLSEEMTVSIIDVPGHERFIRQMIAGVAGIDLVIPVVAADEGVMPQTREHLEILSLLGIQRSIIAITKADLVDEEMLQLVYEDIVDYIEGSGFEGSEVHIVDAKSGRGLDELKESITAFLSRVPSRNRAGAFRLPIDQVFTLQGHGTIVRGTIFDGEIRDGEQVKLLPDRLEARVRQIQTHNKKVDRAFAGQRVAINLAGINKHELIRGQVIVNSNHYAVTSTIDLAFTQSLTMFHELKQRSLVTVHIGTAEVRGTIVFFDRNVLESGEREELFCQIRLHRPIAAKKGDHVIVRRPTPVETIGGGSILNVSGEKYKFGNETIEMFEQMSRGTPFERLEQLLDHELLLSKEQVMQHIGLDEEAYVQLTEESQLVLLGNYVTSENVFNMAVEAILVIIRNNHQLFPMRKGTPKAELIQEVRKRYPVKLVEAAIELKIAKGELKQTGPFLSEYSFQPYLPNSWKTRMTQVIGELAKQELNVSPIDMLIEKESIPDSLKGEFKQYLLTEHVAVSLTDELYVHKDSWEKTITDLKSGTGETFTLQEAKDILNVSRKYLVPVLEKLDESGYTIRKDRDRYWRT
ncbi:selenocysteine-specific translation elongation factor [Pseudalkalibacillus hwajinpoensis]|uniref:Selenocysteine-specific elongation factor n=2 Tax=Guptibacillus hwajinpoensis TaxID=208199 RepID=A0A4U1ML08_9BACL|nr:selenocysteine-specific translation elongation factor [Pseudalkalibacillus hwajinpoensis]